MFFFFLIWVPYNLLRWNKVYSVDTKQRVGNQRLSLLQFPDRGCYTVWMPDFYFLIEADQGEVVEAKSNLKIDSMKLKNPKEWKLNDPKQSFENICVSDG